VAMDPESKLLLAIDAGDRTLAMAQRVIHHVAQVLAPDCAPLFLTDGFNSGFTNLSSMPRSDLGCWGSYEDTLPSTLRSEYRPSVPSGGCGP
jgi:hypothetical protein